LNAAVEPFRDLKVRQALQHAMNVDRVIKDLLKGDYQRLQGLSQGYGPYTHPKIRARAFDVKLADQLLDEAGWTQRDAQGIRMKNGQKLAATVTYSQSTMTSRLIVLREEARKAGFDLGLQLLDHTAAYKTFQDKRHQLAFIAWSTAYRPEYRTRFHSSNALKPMTSNYSNTASPVLDQLIEEYEHASDEGIRISKAHAIQQLIHDDATHIPLFEVPYFRLAYWAWLRFPTPPSTKTADSLSFFDAGSGGLFWIDPQLQKTVLEARKKGNRLEAITRVDETYRLKQR
jgi:microcin C transport system substrate-binding protein